MTKRNSQLNPSEFLWVALNATTAELKARPVRTADGMASSAMGERGMPKMVSTSRKTTEMVRTRKPIQRSSPARTCPTCSGVASMAS